MGNSIFSIIQCASIKDDYYTLYTYKRKKTKPEIDYELEKKRTISFSELDDNLKCDYQWNSHNETWEIYSN